MMVKIKVMALSMVSIIHCTVKCSAGFKLMMGSITCDTKNTTERTMMMTANAVKAVLSVTSGSVYNRILSIMIDHNLYIIYYNIPSHLSSGIKEQ